MIVRGFVYVLTTPISPNLCRITFSAKSPELRVKEMIKKKPDQRFTIEYAVVVDSPHRYCRIAREKLTEQGKHEWKEWFRCTPEEAAVIIRDAIGRARIYSETVRGEERMKRDIEAEKKEASATVSGRGADQKQVASAVVQPLQDSGDLRRKGEEEVRREIQAVAAEKKVVSEPLAGTATPENSVAVAGAAGEQTTPRETTMLTEISVSVGNPEIQRYLLKEQEEALRMEKEEVRLALKERRRGTEQEKEKKKRRVWVPGRRSEEEGGSPIGELIIVLLADMGCLYLVFAAKGVLFTVVGVVLVGFFTLLLVDNIRTLRERKKSKSSEEP